MIYTTDKSVSIQIGNANSRVLKTSKNINKTQHSYIVITLFLSYRDEEFLENK